MDEHQDQNQKQNGEEGDGDWEEKEDGEGEDGAFGGGDRGRHGLDPDQRYWTFIFQISASRFGTHICIVESRYSF